FTTLYRSVPRHMALSWRDVLPGGLVAALMWEVAKRGFALYLLFFARQNYNLLYGSLGVLLALMTWAYMVGFIIVLGAEFSAAYVRHRRAQ
ncbi:YihY/virulence factor BrkB family protein, partial [Bacillus subtilis]|uniref:YihY/virulence factor BrkB family protein n=1 Tax=Bacillus subtilis TaxID=1423 RepID=UPI003C1EC291